MPSCVASNCTNRAEKGFRLFRFPADKARREKWVNFMNRDNWTPRNSSYLCEIHFEDSQFEKSRADNWKKLRPNAVPTLFNLPKPSPRINLAIRKSVSKVTENNNVLTKAKKRANLVGPLLDHTYVKSFSSVYQEHPLRIISNGEFITNYSRVPVDISSQVKSNIDANNELILGEIPNTAENEMRDVRMQRLEIENKELREEVASLRKKIAAQISMNIELAEKEKKLSIMHSLLEQFLTADQMKIFDRLNEQELRSGGNDEVPNNKRIPNVFKNVKVFVVN